MDEERRASERAAARGDGAAWWVTHLRSGTVRRADLELAAWVGDEGAREVLGPTTLVPPSLGPAPLGARAREVGAAEEWISGLERWGVPLLLRALTTLAASDLALLELAAGPPAARLGEALRAWSETPARAELEAVEAAQREVEQACDARADDRGLYPITRLVELVRVAGGIRLPLLRDGARDPRRTVTPAALRADGPLLPPDGPRAREAEETVREDLLALARRGGSLTWEAARAPRACPAPDPPPASDEDLSLLGPQATELAAWLGDARARARLGASVLARWPGATGWEEGALSNGELALSDLAAWLRGLRPFGVALRVRAHHALARAAVEHGLLRRDAAREASRLLDAAEGAPGSTDEAGVIVERARAALGAPRHDRRALRRLLARAGLARKLAGDHPAGRAAKLVEDAVELAAGDGAAWSLARWEKALATAALAHESTGAQAVAAVRGALLPWVLTRE